MRNRPKPKSTQDATVGMDHKQEARFYAYLDGFLTGERYYSREIESIFTAHPQGSEEFTCFQEGVKDALAIFTSKQHSRESFDVWGKLTENELSKSKVDCED